MPDPSPENRWLTSETFSEMMNDCQFWHWQDWLGRSRFRISSYLSHHNPKMNREKKKNDVSGLFTTQRGQMPVCGESSYQNPAICILLQCYFPPMTCFLLPFWNLQCICNIQSVIKTPSLAHSSIRVAVTWKTWSLKYFKIQITLNLKLHFFCNESTSLGLWNCANETPGTKNDIPFPSLFSRKSRGSERK